MSPLENLLNQVSYTNRRRVKDDIKAVMERYKSLLPRIAKFGMFYNEDFPPFHHFLFLYSTK